MAEFTDHPFLGAFAAQWAVMITSAVALCTIALSDLNRHRDAESLLLSLSVAGTFTFCLLNWSINGRSLLPATPAVAILLFRRLESVERGPPFACVGASLAVAAALSLAVAFADYRLANTARSAATQAECKFRNPENNRIWFQGHWGFQYYAQIVGLSAFDTRYSLLSHDE